MIALCVRYVKGNEAFFLSETKKIAKEEHAFSCVTKS